MPTSILSSKGQLVIPKQIRDAMKLRAGDRIDFSLDADNRIILRPATRDVETLKGMIPLRIGKPVTIEDMQRAIEEGAADWEGYK